jgi:hypothetical protein
MSRLPGRYQGAFDSQSPAQARFTNRSRRVAEPVRSTKFLATELLKTAWKGLADAINEWAFLP